MRIRIDRAGQVVVPHAIRERFGVLGGGELEIAERGGVIELLPVAADVEVVESGDGPIAVVSDSTLRLTDEDVRSAVDDSRR